MMEHLRNRMANNNHNNKVKNDIYVDIHGRNLNAMINDDNTIFIPLKEIQKTGFHIFPASYFDKAKVGKSMILAEFHLFMLGQAKEYMLQNDVHSLGQEDILETIEMCRRQLFKENVNAETSSNSGGVLGRTLLANPCVIQQEVRSTLQQSSQRTSLGSVPRFLENATNNSTSNSVSKESNDRALRASPSNSISSDTSKNRSFESDRNNSFQKSSNAQFQNRSSNFTNTLTPSERLRNKGLNNAKPKNDSDSDSKTSSFALERIRLHRNWQKVKVVHVEKSFEKYKYHVQLEENSSIIEDIVLECMEAADKALVLDPKIGDIGMAMSNADMVWYRCVVQKTSPLIKVNYIDFGNEEVVKEVRQLPQKLRIIPAQSVKTTISVQEGAAYPKLCIDDVISVQFIKEYPDSTLLVNMKGNMETPKVFEEIFMENIKFSTALVNREMVKIIAFNDDGKFYLRNKDHHTMLVNVITAIKEFKTEPLTQVAINQVVLCEKKDEEDIQTLCRAVVRNIQGNEVSIQYIDYYNSAIVPKNSVHGITKKIANLPTALIESPVIKDFNPAKLNQQARMIIQKAISEKTKFHVISGINFDLLFANSDSLAAVLFPVEISLRPPKVSPIAVQNQQKSPPVARNSPEPYEKFKYLDMKMYEIPLGIGEYSLNSVRSSDDFTISPTTDEAVELIGKCASIEIEDDEPYEPDDTEVVLARFEDGWYRGAVFDITNGKYNIFFVDFGNMSDCTKEDIRKIPLEHRKIPVMGLTCRMNIPKTEAVQKKFNESMKRDLLYSMNIISHVPDEMVYVVDIPQFSEELRMLDLM